MLICIDESGCPGFKLGKGSTPYFVISMVIFNTFQDAEDTAKAIQKFKYEIKFRDEFKFNKTCDKVKREFFNRVSQCRFQIMALVVDKEKIYSQKLRNDNTSFYNFFLKSLLHYDSGVLENASVKVDGSGDREFKQELYKYLKRNLGEGKISKFRFVDSKSDLLIQLSDMVSGAIYHSYRRDCAKMNQGEWRHALRRHIQNVWDFK